ncbi:MULTISPECIES: hypothetical protein [Luteimonas]|uniref:hypothetical protein n=1 Tax=Luteimonas TaxID=83614 RepID=UPI000C7A2861|nr:MULTISPECIES: hypothetical protein [Luteimonas]
MVFVLLAAACIVVWSLAALLLWDDSGRANEALVWIGAGLAFGVVASLGYGAWGLLRFGDWQALSTGRAVHWLFGEGSVALRRAEWAGLNRAAGVYLNLDITWTLVALCALQFQSIGFWSRIADTRRRRRRRAATRDAPGA